MTTPILTKKQKRQSLSAKKGPVKGLRNILAQPVENYWPIANTDQYPTLITIMNELLPLIKRPTFKIPGSMLRHTPKEQRISARKEALEKETKPNENILKSVILGVNAVTRALEKNNVCCILLDANVEPPFLVKHIVVMAQNKKVPILLLPVLKIVTLQKIGFATIAFALKHDVMESSDNVFHKLYKSIAEVFKDFKPSSQCSLRIFKPDETPEEDATCKVETTSTDSIPSTSKLEKPIVFTDIYKYRSSRKERAFIPPTDKDVNKSPKVSQTPSNEFIPLSSDLDLVNDKNSISISKRARYVNIHDEVKDESKSTKKDVKSLNKSEFIDNSTNLLKHMENRMSRKRKSDVNYLSLKVKRTQGDNNRRKATKFAKKKKK